MSHLTLFLLGTPHIERNGAPLKVKRLKAIALISYLAVSAQSHSRDALATLFWPEYDQIRARAALSTTLSVLKKALSNNWLQIDRKTVSLKHNVGLWVDVGYFLTMLAVCERHDHLPEEVCSACVAPLTKAIELYRGDFLTGFTLSDSANFDDWQRFQTESLRREMIKALEKLVRSHSVQGKFERAITYAQRWLSLESLDESAHRHLMQLYIWSGQPAAALRQYQKCARGLKEELGVPLHEATIRLYQEIKENRVSPPPFVPNLPPQPSFSQNLPTQPTPFLGREKELVHIAHLLGNPSCRLLSLLGPGGIGKTRLALQSAADNKQAFAHGFCFVPLASLNSSDLVFHTIGDALKLSFHGPTDLSTQLFNYLSEKEMLLVLDNLEHLVEGAEVLAEILSNAPGVKLLVTSRQRLNLQWEWFLEIKGLSFPENDKIAKIENYSAIQLFLQSARRVQPNLTLSEAEKPYIVRICQFLEGVPLGIELAAAWTQSLSCREIVEEIERDLSFLTTSLQDVPKRHRNLRIVFDHSWKLLKEDERHVLSKLSVFRGDFRREAAEKVAGASPILLAALLSKSFLRRNTNGRYEMLKVLRRQAEEKLKELPQGRDQVHDLHCEYYAQLLYQGEPHLREGKLKEPLKEIGKEIENVRTGWQWAVAHGKVQEVGKYLEGFYHFYAMRGWFEQGVKIFRKAVQELGGVDALMEEPAAEKRVVLGRILARQGRFCLRLSRYSEARDLLHQSVSILRDIGARQEMAFSLRMLGLVADLLEEYGEAKKLHQESMAIYQKSGDRWGVAECLNDLALIAMGQREYIKAQQLLQESLAIRQEIGNRLGTATCLGNLGLVAEKLGQYQQAKRLHQESLAIYKESGHQRRIANTLINLGFVHHKLGEVQEARKCFHTALETARETQVVDLALESWIGIAALLMQEGKKEQALELVTSVLDHPATRGIIKERAQELVVFSK